MKDKTILKEKQQALYWHMREKINELRLTGEERRELEKLNDDWESLVEEALN